MKYKLILLIVFLYFLPFLNAQSKSLKGQIVDEWGTPIRYARVFLPDIENKSPILTDIKGNFTIDSISVNQFYIRAKREGYYPSEDFVNLDKLKTPFKLSLKRKETIPFSKPISLYPVKIVNHNIYAKDVYSKDYAPFYIKGVCYSPTAIGKGFYQPERVHERASKVLLELNANTVRTYSGADEYMMRLFSSRHIKTIVSFWVDYSLDFKSVKAREEVIEQFRNFVYEYKDYSTLLMWNLGNEQNLPHANGNNPFWYDLAQELAIVAYEIEGDKYHPVSICNGEFDNIGDVAKNADDRSLSYIDVWAVNGYQKDFTPFFDTYRKKSTKPLYMSEWGLDAYDNIAKGENQDEQARYDSLNWVQISKAKDICVGGTVFEFTDEWWKAGNDKEHGFGGWVKDTHPDNFANEEWWGLVSISPDANNDGLDEWTFRKAFYIFKEFWQ